MSLEEPVKKITVPEESGESKEYPINHIIPDNLPLTFVDQMIVQQSGDVFTVSFFQNRQPLILRPGDVEKVTQIDSHCVVRLVFTPETMLKNILALQANWGKFVKKQSGDQSHEGE